MQCHACTRTDGLRRKKFQNKKTRNKITVLLCPDHSELPFLPSGKRLEQKKEESDAETEG
jgi:uncharacterized protein YlaI